MADIVITEFMDDDLARDLARTHDVLYDKTLVDRPDELLVAARGCRALVVRNRTRVDAALLDQCPRLKVIGRLGVGLERIDLEACAARGVVVCPARGANAVAVAEYVIATVLTLFRGTHDVTTRVIAGEWPRESSAGREAAGRVLGLVGLGDIARAVAARAGALGMRLQAHDPYVAADDPVWRALDVDNVALDTLLAGSDVVSLHVPLTDETRGLIDAAAFARMKPGALLVNTTRGGTVDEAALVAVLREGRLGGAALDVFAEEPLTAAAGAKFRDVPNLILTPHIAGVTEESNRRISEVTIANVLRVLDEGG